jgi:WG containing repeat
MEQNKPKFIIYAKGERVGIMNEHKELIVPCTYDFLAIDGFYDGLITCSYLDEALLHFTEQGVRLEPEGHYAYHGFCEDLVSIIDDPTESYTGFCGFMNRQGQIVIPCQYADAHYFQNGLVPVKHENKWGCINADNETIIPFQYDRMEWTLQGRLLVQKAGKWGVMNPKTQKVVHWRYDDMKIDWYSCRGHRNQQWFLLDGFGRELGKMGYDEIAYRNGDHFAVRRGNAFGLIHKLTGKLVIPIEYQSITQFNDGRVAALYGDKWGFLNEKGQWAFPAQYESVNDFQEGLAVVMSQQKYGVIDLHGNLVAPLRYNKVSSFKEGRALAVRREMYGYLDRQGQEVIPLIYEFGKDFSDGLARVCYDDAYGFIDKDGQEIIPFRYGDTSGDFRYGIAAVTALDDAMMGAIDKQNRIVIPFQYNVVWGFTSEGVAAIEHEDAHFYADKTGFIYYEP